MPYDKYNRWIPPADGYDPETGYNWLDHRSTGDLLDTIDNGAWEKIGIGSLQELADLYDTPQWEALNDRKRIDVIKEFQNAYHGDRQNFPWGEDDRASEEWGLDIRRTSDSDGGSASDWEGAYQFFNHMASSEIYPADSKIDWASYNDDNLYDAARKTMVEKHSEFFGENYMNKYDTVKEVRTAQGIIDGWTESEKKSALDWAKTNVTPNKNDDDSIKTFHKTRHFHTSTNTTTYYNHLTGQATGQSKTWLPPAPPTSLKIVKGDAPEPSFNNDGVRIANEADITGWYRQYLNREPDAGGLAHWLSEVANGVSFEQIQHNIMKSEEANLGVDGIAGTADDNKDYGRTYFNPQAYGSPESISAKMVDAPPPIKAPTITIRDIGEPKKPTRHYMALNDTVWTDPSVDTRSTRWDPDQGKRVSTGKPRKDAEFLTEAPLKGGS